MVERRVILEYHPTVRTGRVDLLAEDEHFTARGGMLRLERGDEPQDCALAATAWAQNANELTFIWYVGNDKAHIANRRKLVRLSRVVRFRDMPKLDHMRPARY